MTNTKAIILCAVLAARDAHRLARKLERDGAGASYVAFARRLASTHMEGARTAKAEASWAEQEQHLISQGEQA